MLVVTARLMVKSWSALTQSLLALGFILVYLSVVVLELAVLASHVVSHVTVRIFVVVYSLVEITGEWGLWVDKQGPIKYCKS